MSRNGPRLSNYVRGIVVFSGSRVWLRNTGFSVSCLWGLCALGSFLHRFRSEFVLVEAFLGVAKVARDTHKREVGHSAVALE